MVVMMVDTWTRPLRTGSCTVELVPVPLLAKKETALLLLLLLL
eukprot:COSAG05_NODE_13821_length_417_cov_0.811321_1_plen_42_part_10